jgi:putative tricarboxylic transport membrane protein
MYIGNLILVILNLPLVGIFVNLLRVPFRILFPIILLICLVGTYSVNSSIFELGVLLGFGVVGYVFRELKFDLPPFILAMILGNSMEVAFRQSLMRSGGSFSIFWESPIALTLVAVAGLLFLWNLFQSLKGFVVSWMKALEEG